MHFLRQHFNRRISSITIELDDEDMVYALSSFIEYRSAFFDFVIHYKAPDTSAEVITTVMISSSQNRKIRNVPDAMTLKVMLATNFPSLCHFISLFISRMIQKND